MTPLTNGAVIVTVVLLAFGEKVGPAQGWLILAFLFADLVLWMLDTVRRAPRGD